MSKIKIPELWKPSKKLIREVYETIKRIEQTRKSRKKTLKDSKRYIEILMRKFEQI